MHQKKFHVTKKASLHIVMVLLIFLSSALYSSDIGFSSYTSISDGKYVYTKSPLGCNYSESWEKNMCDDGSKWKMETTINSFNLDNGNLEINGTTLLTNNNLIYGFTGGTFVVAKDSSGNTLCIVGAKNNFIVDSASASNDEAKLYGWGVDPGKIKFYRWKSYVSPKVRSCTWYASIPSSVMELNPTIEIVQCHTPSNRVLTNLNEFMQYTLSFAINNGASIVVIVVKAKYGVLTFSDVTNFIGNVIYWAQLESLITREQGEAARNIVNAINGMYTSGILGLVQTNYNAAVGLVYTIQTVINDRSLGLSSIAQILSYLKVLNDNQKIIVPSTMEYVETILVNLKVLIKNNLSTKQMIAMDKGIALVSAINNLPDFAIYGNMGIVFDSISAAITLAQQTSATPKTVQEVINPILDRVTAAIYKKYGPNSPEMEYFLAFKSIYKNYFIILENGKAQWSPENMTTLIDGFSIFASSISNKDLSIDTLQRFNDGMIKAINSNGRWSPENANALAEILQALQCFEQYPLIKQLKNSIINLK